MRRKTVSGIILSLLLIGMLILTFNIQPVEAEPLDFDPPLIGTPSQEPEPDNVIEAQAVTVSVNVTDRESGVKNVTLWYRTADGITWTNLTMFYNATTQLYQATIPGFPAGEWILYKIIAYDNAGNLCVEDNAGFYYIYQVNPTPGYTLTIYSSPTVVTFTVDGVPRITPWSETYSEGTSISLEMPASHDGYIWDHWSDTDTNRTKTVTMNTNITLTGVFTHVPPPSATIDIDPDTLNLKSEGKWITAYIQLPEGYNPEDIDATTILLNETIQPVLDPKYEFVTNSSEYLVDHNGDGILERMVKFDKAEVKALLSVGEATLTITGEVNGTPFEGTDTIKVLLRGGGSGRRK